MMNEKISKGSFSTIYKGYHNVTKNIVAIKKIKKDKRMDNEIKILSLLKHNKIVQLHKEYEKNGYTFLILEYCENGDLSNYIKYNKTLGENETREFFFQITEGIEYLRANEVIHRDLKPHNILLTNNNSIKIADFGFACFYSKIDNCLCGSPFYMAPEMLKKQKYDCYIDLWSLGIILYQMLVGQVPYKSTNIKELLSELDETDITVPESISIGSECQDLLYSLLEKDVKNRISFDRYFKHPWLNKTSKPIEIPKKTEEPIFNSNFHCFSDKDYLIINSPPQNTIPAYNTVSSSSISNTISNLKKSMTFFSI